VTAGGSDVGGTNDFFHFISRQVVGDFDMAVFVNRLDEPSLLSKAGLMAREDTAPGSRTLQTYFTSPGGSNEVEVSVRATTNGMTTDAGFQIGPRASASPLRWLRLTRTNNTFTAWRGTNGEDGWTVSGITTQAFASTLNIGMMTASHTTNGTPTTAEFIGFRTSGVRPGDGIVPTLTGSVIGTNVVLNWLRTPGDFAVEASTNLTSTNWAFLLLPILEVSTNGRAMEVPLNLLTSSLFLRLRRVERVIPDPPFLLTTGIILSPGFGLDSTPGGAQSPGERLICPDAALRAGDCSARHTRDFHHRRLRSAGGFGIASPTAQRHLETLR
jgi:hypothetical protein